MTDVNADHLPANFDAGVVDEVIVCETAQARHIAQALARDEGILAGTSSGAVLFAASVLAGRPENAGRTIVAVIADSGERYLSREEPSPARRSESTPPVRRRDASRPAAAPDPGMREGAPTRSPPGGAWSLQRRSTL